VELGGGELNLDTGVTTCDFGESEGGLMLTVCESLTDWYWAYEGPVDSGIRGCGSLWK
jgi:hypothetical protein